MGGRVPEEGRQVEHVPIYRPEGVDDSEDDLMVFVQSKWNDLMKYGGLRIDPPPRWIRPQINLHEPPRDDNVKLSARRVDGSLSWLTEESLKAAGVKEMRKMEKRSDGYKERIRIPVRDFRIMDFMKREELIELYLGRSSLDYPPIADEDLEHIYWQMMDDEDVKNSLCVYYADEPAKKHVIQVDAGENSTRGIWHSGNIAKHPFSALTSVLKSSGVNKILFSQFPKRTLWSTTPLNMNHIIFNHFGCRKAVYIIPPSEAEAFRRYCEKKGFEFSSERAVLLNPADLLADGFVGVRKALLKPQSFLVVGAGSMFSVLDLGFNVSDADNFVTQQWFQAIPQSLKTNVPFEYLLQQTLRNVKSSSTTYSSSALEPLQSTLKSLFKVQETFLLKAQRLELESVLLDEATPDLLDLLKKKAHPFDSVEGRSFETLSAVDPRCSTCSTACHYCFLVRDKEVLCAAHALELLTKEEKALPTAKVVRRYSQVALKETFATIFGDAVADSIIKIGYENEDEGEVSDPGEDYQQKPRGYSEPKSALVYPPRHPDSNSRSWHPDSDSRSRHTDSDSRSRYPDSDSRSRRPDSDSRSRRPDSDSKSRHPDSDSRSRYPPKWQRKPELHEKIYDKGSSFRDDSPEIPSEDREDRRDKPESRRQVNGVVNSRNEAEQVSSTKSSTGSTSIRPKKSKKGKKQAKEEIRRMLMQVNQSTDNGTGAKDAGDKESEDLGRKRDCEDVNQDNRERDDPIPVKRKKLAVGNEDDFDN